MISVDFPNAYALWCAPAVAFVAIGVGIAVMDGPRRPLVAGGLALLGVSYLALVLQFALRIDLAEQVPVRAFSTHLVTWPWWDVLFANLEAVIALAIVSVAALGERGAR